MQHTAKGIAALGRQGDDTLLHVNKEELAGLQALLGPVTTNPKTGLPEAFSWTSLIKSLGFGLAGAMTGGMAAPVVGTLGATALGAGTGALLGGGISAAEGKGFGPGALGGAISAGMGAYGGADLTGGPKALASSVPDALSNPEAGFTPGNLSASLPVDNAPVSSWDQFAANASPQWSAMTSRVGMEELAKPVGMGALLGSGAETMADEANTGATQLRLEKQKGEIAKQKQREYFASLGFDLPDEAAGTSWNPETQRNYFDRLIYGAAAGGPIEMSRIVEGIPIKTTMPPKYVSKYLDADAAQEIQPALQQFQGRAQGGYINLQPMGETAHPQSQIPRAQPYAAAAPQRREVVQSYAEGGVTYEKGGFLNGPGDGMSDDIAANIDGREEIRVADGEFIIPPEMVRLIGGGDPEEGKRLLDQLLPMVRQAAHGKKEQVKQNAGKLAAEKLLKRKTHAGRSGIQASGKH